MMKRNLPGLQPSLNTFFVRLFPLASLIQIGMDMKYNPKINGASHTCDSRNSIQIMKNAKIMKLKKMELKDCVKNII
jgi:hypothetical protein